MCVGIVISTTDHLQIQENNEISQKYEMYFSNLDFLDFLFLFLHFCIHYSLGHGLMPKVIIFSHSRGARTDAKGDHFSLLTGKKVIIFGYSRGARTDLLDV